MAKLEIVDGIVTPEQREILAQPVLKPSLGGLPVYSVAEQEPYLNGVMIFAYSKVGKTVLACSAGEVPEMCPVILVDWCEKGTRSARRFKNVDVVYAHTEAEVMKIADELYNKPGRYKTVILDSGTEGSQQIMREIMVKVVADKENKMKDVEVPSQREYLMVYKRMVDVIMAFRNIPNTHVIFTAGARYDINDEEKTKRKMIMPDFEGRKCSTGLPGKMDEVFYLTVNEIRGKQVRVLFTNHREDILCGSREGTLPDEIKEPTMKLLFPLLIKKAKETNALSS